MSASERWKKNKSKTEDTAKEDQVNLDLQITVGYFMTILLSSHMTKLCWSN